ncbi:uncharacterized protein [Antedon mediterranea]|uniref:uncharacterized protein isoform X2 n=1 Tax=Antedon mediterranea TaxID=105859 RepID=UPI003AF63920
MANLEDKFRDLKREISKFYEGQNYLKLKFLLFDHVPIGDLSSPKSRAHDLLNELNITPHDVGLLLEVAKVSNKRGAEDLITQYMDGNHVQNTDREKLSSYRKRLYEALILVCSEGVNCVISYYEIKHLKFDNIWDVVFELERTTKLDAKDTDTIQRFAKCLGPRAKNILLGLAMSDVGFEETLVTVSTWYDRKRPLRMLKVLYQDHIEDCNLDNANKTKELLDELISSRYLSSTNLTILHDTIKVTKQFGAIFFPIAKEKPISTFTHFRQRILDLGHALKTDELDKINQAYNDPPKNYEDNWHLIMDLEQKTIICEEREKLEQFIQTLRQLGIPEKPLTKGADILLTVKLENPAAEDRTSPKTDIGLSAQRNTKNILPPFEITQLSELAPQPCDKKQPFFKSCYQCFRRIGFQLNDIVFGSVMFYLSVIDPYALVNLWKLHLSRKLLEDLAGILVAKEDGQEFLKKWTTHIDKHEFEKSLHKLEEESGETFDLANFLEDNEWGIVREEKELVKSETGGKTEELPISDREEMKLVKAETVTTVLTRKTQSTDLHKSSIEQRMGDEQENKDRFAEFLRDLSNEYEGDKFLLLRFLLYDYIPLSLLDFKGIDGLDLFYKLQESGDIRYTKINLLSEIAEVTNLQSDKDVIKDYTNDAKKGKGLSPYRKALYEALMAVGDDDLRKLRASYKLGHKGFDNIWDLVFHLEKHGRLDSTKVKIKRFASNLNSTAKKKLGNLSKLTVTKEQSQSTSTAAQDLNEDVTSALKELESKEFNVMLSKTSQWYQDRDKITMLRLLFKDIIQDAEEHKYVSSLFDTLKVCGDLTRTNYKVLIDMVKVTDTRGVVEDVKLLSDANKDGEITSFSAYRQQLMGLGKALSKDEAKRVGSVYEVPQNAYTDQWSLIMHLEKTKNVFADGAKELVKDLKDLGLHHVASKLITTNKRSYSLDVPKSKKKKKR